MVASSPAACIDLYLNALRESTAVWEGYVAAGRACSSGGMRKVFHPDCRLTFAADGTIVIVSSNDFCSNVENRWTMEPYVRFSHLKNDVRISAADSLVSVDFAGPNVAMVCLPISRCLAFASALTAVPERAESNAGWWIVAKSSDHEPWMKNERRIPALT